MDSAWRWYPRAYGYQRLAGHSRISWGFLAMENYDILTVKMAPLGPSRKLVIFMHGYLDHSGNYTNFYDEMVRHGISVVTFDMPGHGLSSGPRASINNFEVYGKILGELAKRFGKQYDEVVLAGFSTGGSAIMEARRLGVVDRSLRAVMIAPLYRIKHYWIAEPAFLQALSWKYDFGWAWLDGVLSPHRQPTVITHDEIFQTVLDRDPIAPEIIPEAWTLSYIVYADRIQKWSDSLSAADRASFGELLVLQGDDDNVVDAEQGTTLIANTFTKARIQWIPNGRHALLNEGIDGDRDILPEVYGAIVEFIKP
jgi:alpha-beta hydrolase superfamily lysophospholipase